jgi:hypothetical protein
MTDVARFIDPAMIGELQLLTINYASGVDRRDRNQLLSSFHPDATLTVPRATEVAGKPPVTLRGHVEIGRITERIAIYAQTFHFIGQSSYAPTDVGASGEIYCIAHHRWRDKVELDHVMYIRYHDMYRLGTDDHWRIATRALQVDWTETKVVDVPGKTAR